MRYVFQDGLILGFKNADKADPQTIGTELDRLADAHGGDLKPQHVVEVARHARHPLHQHFEWDDKVCGEIVRLDQARALIRCVRVITDDRPEPLRCFLSISDRGARSYRKVSEVLDSPRLQLKVMEQGLRDLESWERRYDELREVCQLVSVARTKLRDIVDRTRADIESVAVA